MVNPGSHWRMRVTPVNRFLEQPPTGFSVESFGSGYRVQSDPEKSLVLIDDFQSCMGKVVFQSSMGRKVKMHNLCEYSSVRKSLLSKGIHLLVSACGEEAAGTGPQGDRELKQFVVSINGSDPFFKWQMEKGLDWTISSVAGESYRVDIDLSEALDSWAAENISDNKVQSKPVWTDTTFTLKYHSDALFDLPHWFGFSKRTFKVRLT
ncbi:mesenteric estrogen-dependent adipogenesis protein-like [Cololabis saira]|uniref:mesenteric estrogen-dependent adipogenesis protein-like n=1 Tax=Cololabis saira TaxID=129043 RepID=UPI002AD4997B|nr:mesenteric estrogen-dependent adipogenesis protein-like [Cololabis saira]